MSIASISPQEFAELNAHNQKLQLIDVRTPIEFREVHLAKATNIPLDELDPATVLLACGGSKDESLYVICRTGSRAQQAGEKLEAAGFTHVVNVEGGTLACIDSGLPVLRGKKVMSLERQVRIAAGSLVLTGMVLGWLVHPVCLALSAFVGAGLVFSGVTDTCAMGLVLARLPWNQVDAGDRTVCTGSKVCE